MAEALFGMRQTQAARGQKTSPEIAFGRVLRALRREQGVSQDELGARSGYLCAPYFWPYALSDLR